MFVSPAIANRAGRAAASNKLCRPISWVTAPIAAPRTPYWASRGQPAPAIAPTMTDISAKQIAETHSARETALRPKVYVAFSAVARSTSSPAAHCSTGR